MDGDRHELSAGEKFLPMTRELYDYVVKHGVRPHEVLEKVDAETAAMGSVAVMQTPPDQGALISLLVRAIGAGRALELGTFTGYAAISIARALTDDGLLVTCEVDPERAQIARRWFAEANLENRIEVRVGPALETLLNEDEDEGFDFAYIDADKDNYPAYYEECIRLVRSGGLIMVDNTLFSGRVLDPQDDASAAAIAELNDRIAGDDRVHIAMLGVADGVTLALKR